MHLTPTEITFLADSFARTNPMSPFVNNKQKLDGTEAASLEEKGVFKDGKLTEEAARLLLPLSAPERCARMIVQKSFAMLEKYTYLSAEKLTLAESNGGGLVITPLEGDSQPVIDVLSDFVSGAGIKNADIHLSLPAPATLLLLACIDLCRIRAIGAYTNGQGVDLHFSQEEVVTQLTSPFINGLVYGLAGNCGVEMPQAESLPALMALLEEKGCIRPAEAEGRWQLTSDLLLFARNFLLYDSLVLLEAFEMTGENRMGASLELVFCAGMYDNISFSMSPEGFEIETLSGADLRARIKETLDCPSFRG